MAEHLDRIPENLKAHLREVARSAGLPPTEDNYERLARAWLEKKACFEEQIRRSSMEAADRIPAEDERGFLVMTHSGSLIKVGPLVEGARRVEYSSIGLRCNVPEVAVATGARLAADVAAGAVVSFAGGPVRSSSPAFRIAVFANPLGVAQQEERLSFVMRNLAREFVRANGRGSR